jgi:hypothetical protein
MVETQGDSHSDASTKVASRVVSYARNYRTEIMTEYSILNGLWSTNLALKAHWYQHVNKLAFRWLGLMLWHPN